MNGKLTIERNCLVVNPKQLAINGVEAVGDIGEEKGLWVFEKSQEHMGEYFIRAISHEHLIGFEPIVLCDGLFKRLGIGIGIKPQALVVACSNRC